MNEPKLPAVYILASKRNGTLYTGVTSSLWSRVASHINGDIKGFTQKYNVKILVWYEHHHFMDAAIKREKQIKEWKRAWKLEMIEKMNPEWRDLHDEIDSIATLVPINHH
jgi:putative endonuclease